MTVGPFGPIRVRRTAATLTPMGHDRNGLEILDRSRCLGLLATVELGRVALSDRALPIIVPVEFWLSGDDIVFRTTGGLLATAAREGHIVCFEADSGGRAPHDWSVLVVGELGVAEQPVDRPAALAREAPWRLDRPGETVCLPTGVMSGRLLAPSGPTTLASVVPAPDH